MASKALFTSQNQQSLMDLRAKQIEALPEHTDREASEQYISETFRVPPWKAKEIVDTVLLNMCNMNLKFEINSIKVEQSRIDARRTRHCIVRIVGPRKTRTMDFPNVSVMEDDGD